MQLVLFHRDGQGNRYFLRLLCFVAFLRRLLTLLGELLLVGELLRAMHQVTLDVLIMVLLNFLDWYTAELQLSRLMLLVQEVVVVLIWVAQE